MSVILALLAYIYNPSDWLSYPRLDEICNFTADAFSATYAVTSKAIILLDEESLLPQRVFGSAAGLPSNIALAAYDSYTTDFWVVTEDGELYSFDPTARIARRIFLGSTAPVKRLGISQRYVFLDHGSSIQMVDKLSEREVDYQKDDRTVWIGKKLNLRNDYPFLAPWFFVDEELDQRPYSLVSTFHNKAFVSVKGYGYLVFDALAWREILRYESPEAQPVHSFFAADSSLYAFGSNGVDQIVQGKLIFHSFDRWGTSTYTGPSWSDGLMDKLHSRNFTAARLTDGNLFLLENYRATVANINLKSISEITSQPLIYDVDLHADSLFVATASGVFLTLIPKGEPQPLQDERSKLYRDDVLAIVRGRNARYFWTGRLLVKQSAKGWSYFVAPGFMPVPQRSVSGRDSLIVLGGQGGVAIYNPETNFQLSLTSKEGLLSDNVTAVYLQGHYLWVATDAGFSRFDLKAVLP